MPAYKTNSRKYMRVDSIVEIDSKCVYTLKYPSKPKPRQSERREFKCIIAKVQFDKTP